MSDRICDKCGKSKDVKGGATCETGHFICKSCVNTAFLGGKIKNCPICRKSLR